jgi:nitrate/TMAO reductase-like tetraheme cytochrome c subunit
MSDAQGKKCTKCHEFKSLENFYGKENSCKRCKKDRYLQKEYDIGITDWEEMYENQERKCAICRGQFNTESAADRKKIHVDHNHHSRQVRGLLCANCNKGIGLICKKDTGFINENPVFLLSSCSYLLCNDEEVEESADVAKLRDALKELSTRVDEIEKKKNDKHES